MEKKVLIVENNLSNGIAALIAMEELGLEARLVLNVDEALEALKNDDFLFVLSDMVMPLEKGSSTDKSVGKIIIRECINQLTPSAVVTGGIVQGHHHKGQERVIDILIPDPVVAVEAPISEFELKTVSRIRAENKDKEIWKKSVKELEDYFGKGSLLLMEILLRAKQTLRKKLRS